MKVRNIKLSKTTYHTHYRKTENKWRINMCCWWIKHFSLLTEYRPNVFLLGNENNSIGKMNYGSRYYEIKVCCGILKDRIITPLFFTKTLWNTILELLVILQSNFLSQKDGFLLCKSYVSMAEQTYNNFQIVG